MSPKNQRKTIIVDRATQLRIVLSTSLPMFGCLVVATIVDAIYRQQVAAGRIPSDGTIFGFPEERLGMLLLFVSAASVQLLSALIASHKVAGTTYRIGRVMRAFRAGDRAARVKLRGSDFQHDLADEVNELLDWMAAQETTPPPAASIVSRDSAIRSALPLPGTPEPAPWDGPRPRPAGAPPRETLRTPGEE